MATTYSIDLERLSSQSASITDAAQTGLDISGDFTFETWWKPESLTDGQDQCFFIKQNSSGGGSEPLAIYKATDTGDNIIQCEIHSNNSGSAGTTCKIVWNVEGDPAIVVGTWVHIAIVCTIANANATKMELFLNGVSEGNGTVASGTACASIFNGDGDCYVGDVGENPGTGVDGLLADVRIWNTTRSAVNILANMSRLLNPSTDTNLKGNWFFALPTFTDRSGNGNTLTNNNSAVFSADYPYEIPEDTKVAIENGDSSRFVWVLAIEGYPHLITNGSTSAVQTAWAGTDWGSTTPLPGLIPPGSITQSLIPFRPQIEHDIQRFIVHDDEDETFAVDVFKTAYASGDAKTRLSANETPESTPITVEDNTDFAASGDIYVGVENIATLSKDGTTGFHVSKRGQYSPFKAAVAPFTWGRYHKINTIDGTPVVRPDVSEFPRTWVGKWVGLWLHENLDGVLTPMQGAQLEWAGRIQDIEDGGRNTTVISCTDVREVVQTTMLLSDQFIATPSDVRPYLAGWKLKFRAGKAQNGGAPSFDDVTVTVGDATFPAGDYNIFDVVAMLNISIADQLNNDGTDFFGADGGWSVSIGDDGFTTIRCDLIATTRRLQCWVSGDRMFLEHMGFNTSGNSASVSKISDLETDPSVEIKSDNAAVLYYLPIGNIADGEVLDGDGGITLKNPVGTWIDQTDYMPDKVAGVTISGGNWGYIKLGNYGVALARYLTDTSFAPIYMFPELNEMLGLAPYDASSLKNKFQRVGEGEVEIKQLLVMQGATTTILKQIFYSTGLSGYNHATYDVLDYGLGCSIPATLLGANFESSVDHMDGDLNTQMTIILDKSTKLTELLTPELQLRNAHLMFKDGVLQFMTPSQPGDSDSEWVLTESNKAAGVGTNDTNRAKVDKTSEMIVNDIKIEYNRQLDGTYKDVVTASNEASKTDHGMAKPITIKARGHFGAGTALGDDIRNLFSNLAAQAFTLFGKPVAVVTRSINYNLFNVVPGDIVALTDNSVRSNLTGARGIISEPGWVMEVEKDWRSLTGQIKVVLTDDDPSSIAPYSPCADVDDTAATAGYVSGTKVLTLYANRYSDSGEAVDASHFAVGDKVMVTERSPVTITAPQKWSDTVAAVSGNTITLTTGLAGYVTDGTVLYRLHSDDRTTAVTAQKTDCYLADDADNKIANAAFARVWTLQQRAYFDLPDAVATDRYEYPVDDGDWDTEDMPVHPGMHRAAVDACNILARRRTGVSFPFFYKTPYSSAATAYALICTFPLYLGRGEVYTTDRVLQIKAIIKSPAAETMTLRVTSSHYKPNAQSVQGPVGWFGIKVQQTITSNTGAQVLVTVPDLVPMQIGDMTWITIEAKTAAGGTGYFYGLSQAHLGESDLT